MNDEAIKLMFPISEKSLKCSYNNAANRERLIFYLI